VLAPVRVDGPVGPNGPKASLYPTGVTAHVLGEIQLIPKASLYPTSVTTHVLRGPRHMTPRRRPGTGELDYVTASGPGASHQEAVKHTSPGEGPSTFSGEEFIPQCVYPNSAPLLSIGLPLSLPFHFFASRPFRVPYYFNPIRFYYPLQCCTRTLSLCVYSDGHHREIEIVYLRPYTMFHIRVRPSIIGPNHCR
jgi:hypothetical protein